MLLMKDLHTIGTEHFSHCTLFGCSLLLLNYSLLSLSLIMCNSAHNV